MKSRPVVFISLEEYDNLGVGYLCAVLSLAGYNAKNFDFRLPKKIILEKLQEMNPMIVGFSVIYEDYIDVFADMMRFLRDAGIRCHFVAGGFYASLRHEEIFEILPSLDSVVRFEGENTILELADCVSEGREWNKVKGIVCKEGNTIITNPLRPPERDLDKFPYPRRAPLKEYALGKKFATLIASRGCTHNCIFCNISDFYKRSSAGVKRLRKPANVVSEMELLHKKEGCSVFLFSDDDFPASRGRDMGWVELFCSELRLRNLDKRIMWKINCRPDDIDHEIFTMMKEHGLCLAFLGIEDGTDEGLACLNKNMSVKDSLRGINILKQLRIGFDYGFMLFQPSSTFTSINENLTFLETICGDGYTPVSFLKVQPYFETRLEKALHKEGRLKGRPGYFDYDFTDKSLDHYFLFVSDCLREWLLGNKGLLNFLKWARNYLLVYSRYFDSSTEFSEIFDNVKSITAYSNLSLLETLKELTGFFETGRFNNGDYNSLRDYKERICSLHDESRIGINDQMKLLLQLTEQRK
jgi:anaerobic magnesium-protoporphyrin IX monomethyl ester cyclase